MMAKIFHILKLLKEKKQNIVNKLEWYEQQILKSIVKLAITKE